MNDGSTRQKVGKGLLLALLLALVAGPASATLYTVDGTDPDRFFSFTGSFGTIDGEIRQVDLNTVNAGDIVLSSGTVNFAIQDVLVVEVVLNVPSSPMDFFGFSAGGNPGIFMIQGAGTLAGAGQAPQAATYNALNFSADFDFDNGVVSGDNLEQGETSVRLFSTYAAGALNPGDTGSFMVSTGAGDQNFIVSIVVPEPSTLVLAMLGLAGLGRAARQRQRAN